jgi:hypothetical protein
MQNKGLNKTSYFVKEHARTVNLFEDSLRIHVGSVRSDKVCSPYLAEALPESTLMHEL